MEPATSHEPLLAPIAGAAPAGIDLAYDADFDRVGAEIEKLNSLAAEIPDWPLIATEAERLLREKSKDLRVMGWLVAAKAHQQGWLGIETGLTGYLALTRVFWDDMFPPRARGRARAGQVEWLCGVLARRVAALPAEARDAVHVRALEPLVGELGAYFTAQLGELAPVMGPLRVAVREKIRQLPEDAAPAPVATPILEPAAPVTERRPPAAEPPPVATPAPVLAPITIDASTLGDLEKAQDLARALREPLTTLAHHARQIAGSGAWPYRLLRVAAWLAVEQLPESERGKTFVRAPKDAERAELAARHAAAQWDAVCELAEEAVGIHPFWLDAHRWLALALDAKGATHRAARTTVGRELTWLLQRLEGLEKLSFSNGTPFASAETLDWIGAERARYSAASGAADLGRPGSAFAEFVTTLDTRLVEATPEVALGEALVLAHALPTARDRFRARLAVARRARSSGQAQLALVLFEQLLPEVDATLEAWEPRLAAEMLGGYLEALRDKVRNFEGGAADEEANNRTEAHLYRRLLILDPHAALRSGTPW
jgi:type VI secretion system protein VasJ